MTTTINASTSAGLVNTADTSGVLQLQTANTTALTITAAQLVGIGTASPSTLLHTYAASGGNKLTVEAGAVSQQAVVSLVTNSATPGQCQLYMGKSGATTNGQVGYDPGSDAMYFYTANAERMRITSAGYVGIGTTTPAALLDVGSGTTQSGASPTNIYSDLRINAASTGIGSILNPRVVGLAGSYTIAGAAAINIAPFVMQTGVTATNTYGVYIGDVGDGGAGGSVTNKWGIYQSASSNTNYFSGNLLVGTTSGGPIFGGEKIVSSGAISIKTTGTNGLGIWTNSSGSGSSTMCQFYNGSGPTAIGSITGNGTNTAYNTSSDYRLKENIAPMTDALATVSALKPVTYKWKSTGEESQGFIAHELQAVVPDCVTGEKDAVDAEGNPEYQGIDTSFLVATLTAAIQEQQALITNLTTRLAALEGAK